MLFHPPIAGRTAALALALCAFACPALADGTSPAEAAPAPHFSLSAELDANSHYVWRGIAYSRGAVLNPSLTLGYGALSLNAWANVDHDPAQRHRFNELDWTLTGSWDVLGLTLAPSALRYTYPGMGAASTNEFALDVRRDVGNGLAAFTHQAVTVVESRNASYSAFGIAWQGSAWRGMTPAAQLQYGRGWWRFAESFADPSLEGLNVADATASVTVPLRGGFSARPHLEWTRVGQRAVRRTITGQTPWIAGIAFDRSFGGE